MNKIVFFVSLITIFISCEFKSKNSLLLVETNFSCINDTSLTNKTFIKYYPKLDDSICLLSISIKGVAKKNIDSFYIDKNDCRMVPKLVYSNDSCLFLLSGLGFTYRKLYTFSLRGKNILKTELQFDILESDLNNSYYPYIKDQKLYVLKIDSMQKVTEYKTQITLHSNLIKKVGITKNEITVIQDDNKVINATIQ